MQSSQTKEEKKFLFRIAVILGKKKKNVRRKWSKFSWSPTSLRLAPNAFVLQLSPCAPRPIRGLSSRSSPARTPLFWAVPPLHASTDGVVACLSTLRPPLVPHIWLWKWLIQLLQQLLPVVLRFALCVCSSYMIPPVFCLCFQLSYKLNIKKRKRKKKKEKRTANNRFYKASQQVDIHLAVSLEGNWKEGRLPKVNKHLREQNIAGRS